MQWNQYPSLTTGQNAVNVLDWQVAVDVTNVEPPVIPDNALSAERAELLVLCKNLPVQIVGEVLAFARDSQFRWSQKGLGSAVRTKQSSEIKRIRTAF